VTEVRQLGESPPDLVTAYAYDELKDLTQVTLPDGKIIEYGYDDPAGRLTSIERKRDATTHGERVVYTLDKAGNRTLEEHQRWDPDAQDWITLSSTAYDFDNRCQVHAIRQAPGTAEEAKTTFAYDCDGNLEQVWQPNLDPETDPATTTYTYDYLNRVASVAQPWQPTGGNPGTAVTTYSYDEQDHLIGVTDAEGNATSYVYSDRDLLTYEQSVALATVANPTDPANCPETCSLGCGCTAHGYNLHGEETGSTDARGVTVGRTVDELDRVTDLDYDGTDLDVHYDYDADPGPCGSSDSPVGRLAAITRNGQTLDYCTDHFGRTVKDGELTYSYDKNGNRTGIVYPGGVNATYGFDFADRQASLGVTTPAGGVTPHPVVTGAAYLPSGPLSSLALGNGASETRAFDGRYVPAAITLSGLAGGVPGHTWSYTTDPVGNVTEILETPECAAGGSTLVLESQTVMTEETFSSCADLQAGNDFAVESPGDVTFQAQGEVVLTNGFSVGSGASFAAGSGTLPTFSDRTYTYQPPQYFLTSASLDRTAGSWGTLDWTYDKIGNRLSESRDGGATADGYQYTANTDGGDTPLLDHVDLAVMGTRNYAWDAAGNLDSVATGTGGNSVDFTFDDASRLAAADRTSVGGGAAAFLYDGRGFLRSATQTAGGTASVTPLYDSAGLLHALRRQPSSTDPVDTTYVFYLAGRPVAQLAIDSTGAEAWTYLTTDHLGTPLVATDQSGAITWQGGFQPFGTDYQANGPAGASENGIPLRLPGQWVSDVWADATSGAGIHQNVWRWLEPQTGRYTSREPVGIDYQWALLAQRSAGAVVLPELAFTHPYEYVDSNPLAYVDPEGLHKEGGPWHPDRPFRCRETDSCAELRTKISLISRAIAAHRQWDRSRGTNRHEEEIRQLIQSIERCKRIHEKNCKAFECKPCEKMKEVGPVVATAYVVYKLLELYFCPPLVPVTP
jgi:RHS repeat-associated protein